MGVEVARAAVYVYLIYGVVVLVFAVAGHAIWDRIFIVSCAVAGIAFLGWTIVGVAANHFTSVRGAMASIGISIVLSIPAFIIAFIVGIPMSAFRDRAHVRRKQKRGFPLDT